MILKLEMDHRKLKGYKVYVNNDPGLTLTYFSSNSNLVEITYYAYTRPRCLVSVYRTIGSVLVDFKLPQLLIEMLYHLSLVLRKPVLGVSDQVQHKPGCTATEDG